MDETLASFGDDSSVEEILAAVAALAKETFQHEDSIILQIIPLLDGRGYVVTFADDDGTLIARGAGATVVEALVIAHSRLIANIKIFVDTLASAEAEGTE